VGLRPVAACGTSPPAERGWSANGPPHRGQATTKPSPGGGRGNNQLRMTYRTSGCLRRRRRLHLPRRSSGPESARPDAAPRLRRRSLGRLVPLAGDWLILGSASGRGGSPLSLTARSNSGESIETPQISPLLSLRPSANRRPRRAPQIEHRDGLHWPRRDGSQLFVADSARGFGSRRTF
jgi:hypothetical protein